MEATREAESKRRDEAFALGKSELFATFIEDGLELVSHRGKVLGIHATFLLLIEGVRGLDGSCQKSS